jgi:hypothetical protein
MSVDPEWLAECRERAPAIANTFASQIGKGDRVLSSPGCPKGCGTCTRECAIRYIKADWWTREHAKAEAEAAVMTHNGVSYSDFGRRQ